MRASGLKGSKGAKGSAGCTFDMSFNKTSGMTLDKVDNLLETWFLFESLSSNIFKLV